MVVRRFMRGNRGITLLEMFVVFLIMSIVMGMLLSAVVSTMASNRLAASISGVAGAIRTARSLAITSGEIHNVRFIAGNEPRVEVYWKKDDGTNYEIAGAGVRLEYTTSFVTTLVDPLDPIAGHPLYDLIVQNPEELNLFFYPDGSGSVDGATTIGIRNQGKDMRIIEVLGVTGEITERRTP